MLHIISCNQLETQPYFCIFVYTCDHMLSMLNNIAPPDGLLLMQVMLLVSTKLFTWPVLIT